MNPLPLPNHIKEAFPLSATQGCLVEKNRETVRQILDGRDARKLLIVGPCSIHEMESAEEFATRLKKLSDEVSHQFFIVMRTYFEKPRTTLGWKGFLYDPYLDASYAVHEGVVASRQFLLKLTDMGLPTATEFLDPLTASYFDDLITWGSIGARTASSQIHRHLASSLPMPVGFKNGVAGNISAAISGAIAASHSHTFLQLGPSGGLELCTSKGNSDVHVVLRGGESGPNFDKASISHALKALEEAKLPSRLIVDCAHHNSAKNEANQAAVFHSVLHQILEGNDCIKGIMLESHLFSGNQPHVDNKEALKYGISITDPCLCWETTANLILFAALQLQQQRKKVTCIS